jgi:hypothetical protein
MGDITARLRSEFAMTDLDDLSYFWGISVTRSVNGLLLSQQQCAIDLLHLPAWPTAIPPTLLLMLGPHSLLMMVNWSLMPLITAACKRTSVPDAHPTGSLISIQQVCLYMNAPCEPHLALVKHILRYIKGTMDFGLHIGISDPITLTAYSDADCVPDTQCSTSSFCIFSWW